MKTDVRESLVFLVVLSMAVHGCGAGLAEAAKPFILVAPNAYENVDGESHDNPNFFLDDNRWQQLIPASEFESVPDTHRLITRIVPRPDKEATVPWEVSWQDVVIRLSTTDKSVGKLSNTFDDNIGPDDIPVYWGPLTYSASGGGPPEGPRGFYSGPAFMTAFPYNPIDGDLLIDFITVSGSDRSTMTDMVDAQTAYGGNVWVWSRDPGGREASDRFGAGMVWEVTFVPEPSTFVPVISLALTLLAAAWWRWRQTCR